jgi:hypothetical protein
MVSSTRTTGTAGPAARPSDPPATMQQVGNSIGVAVTGVIFFGAVRHGYAPAFGWSVTELVGLLLGVAALSRLLPGRNS